MTIQLNTGKAELLFVKVPESASEFSIESPDNLSFNIGTEEYEPMDFKVPEIYGLSFEILGLSDDLTEDQCKELVEGNNGGHEDTMWFNYIQPSTCFFCFTFNSATESFKSFMDKHDIYSVNPYGEEPNKWTYPETEQGRIDYWDDLRDYEQAQQRTGKWLVLKQTI